MQRFSYSSLTNFETCPKQYEAKYVTRQVVDKGNAATKYGNEVHKALEDYAREGQVLPAMAVKYKPVVDKLLKLGQGGMVIPEYKMACAYDLSPRAWGADDVWCRGIADLVLIKGDRAVIVDYKTGKRKNLDDQLMLMSLLLLSCAPDINQIDSYLVWLKEGGKPTHTALKREDAADMWAHFRARARVLNVAHEENRFPASPSGLCRGWCPVTSCEHWRERR